MCDFSFCVPSSEKVNPAKNGTSRGPAVPLSENFFNELCWETTLFEFSSPKDIPQNSKQNNGSLVEEVWKHEGMGGIYELGHTKSHMRWESPKSAHTPSADASFTYHTVSLTPKPTKAKYSPYPGPSEVRRRCRNIPQNKTFITAWFSAAHILAKA